MKHLIFFLLFLSSINLAFAQNWCDPSCNLSISFPEGGSIDATEALTLTFSQNGLLDLGEAGTINASVQPANTNYSNGGELSLSVGESITFGKGGLLELGSEGNINTTYLNISTTGDVSIIATGSVEIDSISTQGNLNIVSNGDDSLISFADFANVSAENIYILQNGNNGRIRPSVNLNATFVTIAGGSGIQILESGSDTSLDGDINSSDTLNTDAQISLNNGDLFTDINLSNVNSFGDAQVLGSLPSVSIGFVDTTIESQRLVTSADDSIDIINNTLVYIPANEVLPLTSDDLIEISINPNQQTEIIFIHDETAENDSAQLIELIALDAELLGGGNQDIQFDDSFINVQMAGNLSGFDGFEFETIDGQNCIVSENECITDDGTRYVLSTQGKLVKAESGGGSIGGISILLFIVYFAFSFYQRKTDLNID